jgi:hypothetical protein
LPPILKLKEIMETKKDIPLNTDIILSNTMQISIDKRWISHNHEILRHNIKYAKTKSFHPSVSDAIKIEYLIMGIKQSCYIHWKDIEGKKSIKKIEPKTVLFDVKELDIAE